jgi:hypothetical protein
MTTPGTVGTAPTNTTQGGWKSYVPFSSYFPGAGTTATVATGQMKTALTATPPRTWADTFTSAVSYIPIVGRWAAKPIPSPISPGQTTGAATGQTGVNPQVTDASDKTSGLRSTRQGESSSPGGTRHPRSTGLTGGNAQTRPSLFKTPTRSYLNPARYFGRSPEPQFNPERFGNDTAKSLNDARSAWRSGKTDAVSYASILLPAQREARIGMTEVGDWLTDAWSGITPFETLVSIESSVLCSECGE